MEYLSKQRYDEIEAELNHLINVVYPQVRDNLAETVNVLVDEMYLGEDGKPQVEKMNLFSEGMHR